MGEFPSLYLVENLDQNPTNEVPIVCSLGQIAYNQEFTPSKTNLKAWWKNDLYFIPESGVKNVKKHENREKTWGNMKKTRKNMKNMKTRAICFRQSINVYAVKKREKTVKCTFKNPICTWTYREKTWKIQPPPPWVSSNLKIPEIGVSRSHFANLRS
jgi:hypothetical protein